MKRNYTIKMVHIKNNIANLLLFLLFFYVTLFSFSVKAQTSDLSITKSVNNNTPFIGDAIIFTLTITNNGPDIATGIAVLDEVPSGYGSITNISNGGATIGNSINWTGLIIQPNTSVVLTLNVTVLSTGTYNNRAEITASNSVDPDSDPTSGFDDDDFSDGIPDDDESDLVIVIPHISDLSIEKLADNLEPNKGTEVIFTIIVNNDGPSDVSNVTVSDQLPQGFIWISDDSFGDYDPSTGIWSIGSLGNGSSVSLNINVIVSLIDEYTNTAEIITSDSFDPDSAVNNNDPDVMIKPVLL